MAVNIFDELHSATTDGIVADDSQIRHGDSNVSKELEKKIDNPSGGSDGQVLTLDGDKPAWKDASADNVSYDPTTSGMSATTTQAAIEELFNSNKIASASNDGISFVDEKLNIGFILSNKGLDVFAIAQHLLSLIVFGYYADRFLISTDTPGFQIIDQNYNIGLLLNENGLFAKDINQNIVEL